MMVQSVSPKIKNKKVEERFLIAAEKKVSPLVTQTRLSNIAYILLILLAQQKHIDILICAGMLTTAIAHKYQRR